jgi:hypothetical protein
VLVDDHTGMLQDTAQLLQQDAKFMETGHSGEYAVGAHLRVLRAGYEWRNGRDPQSTRFPAFS